MSKSRLPEILIIRPLLIICIIVGHCFACYSGSWPPPKDFVMVTQYRYINPFFISFQLQAFVFVSGYLFAHNTNSYFSYSLLSFLKKKIRRIIIPSLIFSIIYFLMFIHGRCDSVSSVFNNLLKIANGCGHLWFLPMLFWNYIFLKVFDKYISAHKFLFLISSLIVSIISTQLPNFIGITNALAYSPFMLGGYLFYKEKIGNNNYKKLSIIFVFLFLLMFIVKEYINHNFDSHSLIFHLTSYPFFIIGGFSGTLFLFCFVKSLTLTHYPEKFISKLNDCCYGAYIFQQFIIKILFYNNNLISSFCPIYFPIVILAIALPSSFLLSFLLKKTKFGALI